MYTVLMDNYLSLIGTFERLHTIRNGVMGTVRPKAGWFPNSMAIRNKKEVWPDWDSIGEVVCGSGKALAHIGIDNAPVQMLLKVNQVKSERIVRENKQMRLK